MAKLKVGHFFVYTSLLKFKGLLSASIKNKQPKESTGESVNSEASTTPSNLSNQSKPSNPNISADAHQYHEHGRDLIRRQLLHEQTPLFR